MEVPHEPTDPLPELIERARAARDERDRAEEAWRAASEELRHYAERATLDEDQRGQVAEALGTAQHHHRRRWGAAPS